MNDEERLEELLLDWEERHEWGEDVSASELCRDSPHLLPALIERIELLLLWERLNRPVADSGTESGVELPSGPLDGRFRLDERIGEGGHGQVFRAFDLKLKRQVAVKIPRPDYYRLRPDRRDAFLNEAQRLAQFSYPGIVQVYDMGRHDGYDFIVSEWIDGIDLARLISVVDIPVREAARFVADAARHLHHAHKRGFVHRDVKPANILIRDDLQVVLTDFGIAVHTGEPGEKTGTTGTINYMAPERLSGSGADVRSDVYGLGTVLYELLSGSPPFAGIAGEQLRWAIRKGELDHSRLPFLNERYPQLMAIRRWCMATNPAERYQTAEAVAVALGRLLADSGSHELASCDPVPIRTGDDDSSNTDCRTARAIRAGLGELGPNAPVEALREWVGEKGIKPTCFDAIVSHVRRDEQRRARPEASHELLKQELQRLKLKEGQRERVSGWLREPEGPNYEEVILHEMRRNPSDFTLRLAFADWREERGDDRRAALVRLTHMLTQSVEVSHRSEFEAWLRQLLNEGVRPVGPFRTNRIGSIEMTFAWIPPGVFLMGSPPHEEGRCDNEARATVTLRKGFWMGVHLVTEEHWRVVMGGEPNTRKDLPRNHLSGQDCQDFIRRLRQLDRTNPYRLPSEAEWEYACRAGTTSAFYFGETMTADQANWSSTGPSPVGMHPANAFGLHDMHGNLWEWCEEDVVDGQGESLDTEYRVGVGRIQRGGSWKTQLLLCRSAHRGLPPGDAECGVRICYSEE
jgi:serine/threonine-protein kinase